MIVSSRIILSVSAVVVVAALVFFAVVDPMQCEWAPKCVFHSLTGWQCPGCGFSRSMHALLHGRVDQALTYNYFLVLSVPYALAVLVATYYPAFPLVRRYRRVILGQVSAYTYIALFMVWWIVRNLLEI